MRGVTFGDFAGAASIHLDHAVPPAESVGKRLGAAVRTGQIEEFTWGLCGVLEVMARYLAEITAPLEGISAQDRALVRSRPAGVPTPRHGLFALGKGLIIDGPEREPGALRWPPTPAQTPPQHAFSARPTAEGSANLATAPDNAGRQQARPRSTTPIDVPTRAKPASRKSSKPRPTGTGYMTSWERAASQSIRGQLHGNLTCRSRSAAAAARSELDAEIDRLAEI